MVHVCQCALTSAPPGRKLIDMHQFRYSALCSWRSWGHNDKLSSRAESDSTTLFSESNIPNQVAPTRSTPAPCYVQLRVKELELLHITHALFRIFFSLSAIFNPPFSFCDLQELSFRIYHPTVFLFQCIAQSVL